MEHLEGAVIGRCLISGTFSRVNTLHILLHQIWKEGIQWASVNVESLLHSSSFIQTLFCDVKLPLFETSFCAMNHLFVSQVLQRLLNHFIKKKDKVLLFSLSTKVSL